MWLNDSCIAVVQEQEHSGEQSRLRQLPAQELLTQMPFLQKLLRCLLDCKPTGVASHDAVVQASTHNIRLALHDLADLYVLVWLGRLDAALLHLPSSALVNFVLAGHGLATAFVSPVGIAVDVWHNLTALGYHLISNPTGACSLQAKFMLTVFPIRTAFIWSQLACS